MSASTDLDDHVRRMVARLARYGPLADAELAFLMGMGGELRQFHRGEAILTGARERGGMLYLVEDGWAASSIDLPNGARELVSLNLPGDMLGLPSQSVATPLDTVIALSTLSARAVDSASLGDMFRTQPRLAARLFLIAQEERVMEMERAALAGKAQALHRLAAFVLRLGERMETLRCGTAVSYDWPLTQRDLADFIGVTDVHVNGLVRTLRETNLAHIDKRGVRILNPEELWRLSQISPWRSRLPSWLPDAEDRGG